MIKVSSLKLNPGNPRQIRGERLDLLKRSITEFERMMELRPIVVDEKNVVLGGNMRLQAIKALGKKEIPDEWVKRADDLTEDQKREFIIKDNAGFGEWDWELLANEWDDLPLADWGVDVPNFESVDDDPGTADAEPQIDKAAELNKKWQVKTGDLWQIGEHRLLCGDSTKREDVERLMCGQKADCVFTSPPYAVGLDYGDTYQDTIENLREMLPKLSSIWRDNVVGNGCFAVVNFGDVASGRDITETVEPCEYPMALEYYPVFRADGWLLWSRRIWCKPNPRVNSMQCIGSNRAATDWEHLWTFKTAGDAIIKRVDGEMRSPLGWIDTSLMAGVEEGKDVHGAGMATGIAKWMVNIHSRLNGVVHEPFCGTGTTIVACQNLNRKCYAIEISPNYCAVILERMQTAFPDIEIKRISTENG